MFFFLCDATDMVK